MAEKSGAEKKGKAAKSTKSEPTSSSHHSSAALIKEAISKLNEKGGSSLYAIKKYISDVHKLDMGEAREFYSESTEERRGSRLAEKVKKPTAKPAAPLTKKTAAKTSEAEPKAKEAKSAKTTAAKNPTTVKPAQRNRRLKSSCRRR
ncbi:Histone H1 [Orchesella cincta]|uniref:Histone H1 n=1 Tax=Orchesella cincta TaxID=48709 RepID=A0A1D2N8R2_ORCCI|nr:Histone H1 [Orchesella cincta]